jgi:hypothetical protein
LFFTHGNLHVALEFGTHLVMEVPGSAGFEADVHHFLAILLVFVDVIKMQMTTQVVYYVLPSF